MVSHSIMSNQTNPFGKIGKKALLKLVVIEKLRSAEKNMKLRNEPNLLLVF